MRHLAYTAASGIEVKRTLSKVPWKRGLRTLLRQLDTQRGAYLSSGYEYPGRYSRWDFASVCPALEILGSGRTLRFQPLNERGIRILAMLEPTLSAHPHWASLTRDGAALVGELKPLPEFFAEEERSRQPSAFSILRTLVEQLGHKDDAHLALVGAFGYDLIFQFDPIQLRLPRHGQHDLHLFLCDQIWIMDRKKEVIEKYSWDFSARGLSTAGLPHDGERLPPARKRKSMPVTANHTPQEYMDKVEALRQRMKVGDFYEVVLRQTFRTTWSRRPSELFERIQKASPSPYEFLLQLGNQQLVGASPEMFVRVEGSLVETCPISGTARRTGDPMKDHDAIRELLNSRKEESELTMCTDVDRNDKSRVCVPGSVQVIGRRLIESYAGLFHTVDHVTGTLDPNMDALDAFLTHMWAVTVIGAPKRAASEAIEMLEKDARGWYGGALGMLKFNGDINTGILIRTAHLKDGYADYPAGATLLYDSDPASEERETRLKATGFFRAVGHLPADNKTSAPALSSTKARMLLVDHDDCFIHTLANYARQAGAEITTYRHGFPIDLLHKLNPDIVLVSPGPARPSDFGVPELVRQCAAAGYPVFGVCLGLQGIVEAFGGELGVLDYPMHGKPSIVKNSGLGIFAGLPPQFQVGRYHSLFAKPEKLPAVLEVTAQSEDGVIMGVRHRTLPIEAVQFHPESMLSLDENCGLRLIENVLRLYARRKAGAA
jgi:anthranilate synthase